MFPAVCLKPKILLPLKINKNGKHNVENDWKAINVLINKKAILIS